MRCISRGVDPGEAHGLFAGSAYAASATARGGGEHKSEHQSEHQSEAANESPADRQALVASLLGTYVSALRVGRRSLERAYAEGRVERGSARGWEMIVWFCRQVEFGWTEERWLDASRMMCKHRTESMVSEKPSLTKVTIH